MGSSKPAEPTKPQIERAESVWDGFTKLGKWTVISIIVVLAIMGILFIDWV